MRFLSYLSLPLLTKELIEQAQYKRTYVLRVIYAAVLYSIALIIYSSLVTSASAGGISNLGFGQGLFYMLVMLQAGMILILLPAITCGALTVEKEKDTLALLLLTKLSPWTIVFEKLLSRVIAMGTYQLISLPLFAIVYGMGGVDLDKIIYAIVCLISLTTFVGCLSIFCSTWFRLTSTAFVMTYALVLFFVLCFSITTRTVIGVLANAGGVVGVPVLAGFLSLATNPLSIVFFSLFWGGVLLVISACVLVRRAFLPPRNLVLDLFRFADSIFTRLNDWSTGGIILINDEVTLPEWYPIAWRETRKKSLGTFRYQFRVLMLLLIPLFLAIAAVLADAGRDFSSPFRIFPFYFWIVSIVCLTVHSTAVIPAERIRQSLEVLLVTPVTSEQLIRQKLAGVRRLIKILMVPFALLVGFQSTWTGYIMNHSMNNGQSVSFFMELVATALAPIIYMPLIMWIGFHMGLRLKTQMQAILATFACVGASCAIPTIIGLFGQWIFDPTARNFAGFVFGSFFSEIRWLSPAEVLLFVGRHTDGSQRPNYGQVYTAPPQDLWLRIMAHFFFYGILGLWLRHLALRSFSKIVNRAEPPDQKQARRIEAIEAEMLVSQAQATVTGS